jgi:hypothetical protein
MLEVLTVAVRVTLVPYGTVVGAVTVTAVAALLTVIVSVADVLVQ